MRRSALARGLTAVPLSALVLLAGCGTADSEETAATGTATSTSATRTSAATTTSAPSTGVDDATDAPPFPANTSPDTGEAVAGQGPTVVTGVRVGAQDGFSRVVLDIAGTAVPGWDVAYADAPTQEGSGSALEVPGTTFLRVTLTGVTNPYEATGVAEAATGVHGSPAGPVAGVYYDSVFEGQALAYVGLTAERPFRVYALTNPTRIVVDVQD